MAGAPNEPTTVQTLDDGAIRTALRPWLLKKHGRAHDTVVLDELGLCRGRVRLDLAVVNGSIHGYEIKSDRDSLRRLVTQAEVYTKVLDHVTLVVGDRFRDDIDVVPGWWGVVYVRRTSTEVRFRQIRPAGANFARDARALVELLWADQALDLLERRNAARGVKGKPRRFLWDRICQTFSVDEIADAVREALKARSANQAPA